MTATPWGRVSTGDEATGDGYPPGEGVGTFPIVRPPPHLDTVPMLKQATDRRAAPKPAPANDVQL
jgi:hypothetical protein